MSVSLKGEREMEVHNHIEEDHVKMEVKVGVIQAQTRE
jgi:hypothetical protein